MENVVVKNATRETVKRVYTVSVFKGEKHSNKKFSSRAKAYEYAERRYLEVEVTGVKVNFTCDENENWTKE